MTTIRKITEPQDWWDTISDAERLSIEIGMAQADAGLTVPHDEVRKIYASWLTRLE